MKKIINEEQKRHNRAVFINAAHELIEEDGIGAVSIRRIAERAGFHNSTIYLYFRDADELLLLASVKYFEPYAHALAKISAEDLSVTEKFFRVWECFLESAFTNPRVFYRFFFGKHRDDLSDILNSYYDIFPEERGEYSPVIRDMYFGKNISERCLRLLLPLQEDSTVRSAGRLNDRTLSLINDISVFCLKGMLEKTLEEKHPSKEKAIRDYLELLYFLTGVQA